MCIALRTSFSRRRSFVVALCISCAHNARQMKVRLGDAIQDLLYPSRMASFEQGGGEGGGGFGPKTWCTKNGLTRFSLL